MKEMRHLRHARQGEAYFEIHSLLIKAQSTRVGQSTLTGFLQKAPIQVCHLQRWCCIDLLPRHVSIFSGKLNGKAIAASVGDAPGMPPAFAFIADHAIAGRTEYHILCHNGIMANVNQSSDTE